MSGARYGAADGRTIQGGDHGGVAGNNSDQPARKPAEHLAAYQFQKGKSGNPDGRPAVAKLVKDLCRQNDAGKIEDVIRELYNMALAPKASLIKLEAVKYIIDRVAGKPTQALSGDDGEPLRVGLVILPSETP